MLTLKNINILKKNNSLRFFYIYSKEKKIYNSNFLNSDLNFFNYIKDFKKYNIEYVNFEDCVNFLKTFRKDTIKFEKTTSSKIFLNSITGSWPVESKEWLYLDLEIIKFDLINKKVFKKDFYFDDEDYEKNPKIIIDKINPDFEEFIGFGFNLFFIKNHYRIYSPYNKLNSKNINFKALPFFIFFFADYNFKKMLPYFEKDYFFKYRYIKKKNYKKKAYTWDLENLEFFDSFTKFKYTSPEYNTFFCGQHFIFRFFVLKLNKTKQNLFLNVNALLDYKNLKEYAIFLEWFIQNIIYFKDLFFQKEIFYLEEQLSKKEIIRLNIEKKMIFEYLLINLNLKKIWAIFFLEKKNFSFDKKKQYLVDFLKSLKSQKNFIKKAILSNNFSEELLLNFKISRIFFENKLHFKKKLIDFFLKKKKNIQNLNFIIFTNLKKKLKIENFSSKLFLKKFFQLIISYSLKKKKLKKKINFFFFKKKYNFQQLKQLFKKIQVKKKYIKLKKNYSQKNWIVFEIIQILLKEKIFLEKKIFNNFFIKELIFQHIKKMHEGVFLQKYIKKNIFQNKKISKKQLSNLEINLLLLQEKIELEEKANAWLLRLFKLSIQIEKKIPNDFLKKEKYIIYSKFKGNFLGKTPLEFFKQNLIYLKFNEKNKKKLKEKLKAKNINIKTFIKRQQIKKINFSGEEGIFFLDEKKQDWVYLDKVKKLLIKQGFNKLSINKIANLIKTTGLTLEKALSILKELKDNLDDIVQKAKGSLYIYELQKNLIEHYNVDYFDYFLSLEQQQENIHLEIVEIIKKLTIKFLRNNKYTKKIWNENENFLKNNWDCFLEEKKTQYEKYYLKKNKFILWKLPILIKNKETRNILFFSLGLTDLQKYRKDLALLKKQNAVINNGIWKFLKIEFQKEEAINIYNLKLKIYKNLKLLKNTKFLNLIKFFWIKKDFKNFDYLYINKIKIKYENIKIKKREILLKLKQIKSLKKQEFKIFKKKKQIFIKIKKLNNKRKALTFLKLIKLLIKKKLKTKLKFLKKSKKSKNQTNFTLIKTKRILKNNWKVWKVLKNLQKFKDFKELLKNKNWVKKVINEFEILNLFNNKKKKIIIKNNLKFLHEKINFIKKILKLTKNQIILKKQKLLLNVEINFKKAEKNLKKAKEKINCFNNNEVPFYILRFQKRELKKKIEILKKQIKIEKKLLNIKFSIIKKKIKIWKEQLKKQKLLLNVQINFKKAEKNLKKAKEKINCFNNNEVPFYILRFQKRELKKKIKILKIQIKIKKKLLNIKFSIIKKKIKIWKEQLKKQKKILKFWYFFYFKK